MLLRIIHMRSCSATHSNHQQTYVLLSTRTHKPQMYLSIIATELWIMTRVMRVLYSPCVCECVSVCACVLFYSILQHFLLSSLRIYYIRRRSNYMSTPRFSVACVWGTKRSHYLCCRPKSYAFFFTSFDSSLVVAFIHSAWMVSIFSDRKRISVKLESGPRIPRCPYLRYPSDSINVNWFAKRINRWDINVINLLRESSVYAIECDSAIRNFITEFGPRNFFPSISWPSRRLASGARNPKFEKVCAERPIIVIQRI